MATLTVSDILGVIRDSSDQLYIDRVDEYNGENLVQIGDIITSDKNLMNGFMNQLINKIVESNVKSRMFNNPLKRLKGTDVPMGSTIEEIFVNPAVDVGYQPNGALLLKTTKPDGKVAYWGQNRRSTYPVSVFKNDLKQAFTSESAFMQLYNRILTSMLSGDQIDEFMLTKAVIAKTVDEGSISIVNSDFTDPKQIAKSISNMSKAFKFPNTSFAPYNNVNATKITQGEKPCITFCEPERQVILLRADVETEINFEVLATMFNMELAEIKAMTILVDSFPSTNYDIYAVLCDIDSIQVRDAVFETDNFYNPSNMVYNVWLQHWQFIFCSTFGNMVAFAKAKNEPSSVAVSSLSIDGANTIGVNSGVTTLTATILPVNATDKSVIWTSSNQSIATVTSNGDVTAVGNGTVTITATSNSNNNISATHDIVITNQGV